MYYLEKIAPSYIEILNPLKKWRILSVQNLKQESGYQRSLSSFYKIISKLEKNQLIDSFINTWSNEKFLYLQPLGLKVLGDEKAILPVNRDTRYHDSICSKLALNFKSYAFVQNLYLDQEIPILYPLMEKTPDILIEGEKNNRFRLAIEIELTQKNKTRVQEILKSYSESKVINNVIYITDKEVIFNSYQKYLNELQNQINSSKFIFIYEKDLNAKAINLLNMKAIYQGRDTNLKELLKI
jgi:hypothetical protein